MTLVIDKVDGRALSNIARCTYMPGKEDELSRHCTNHRKKAFKLLSNSNKTECFSYKGK